MFSEKGRQLPDRVLPQKFELVLEGPCVLVEVCEFPVEFSYGEFRREEARQK